MLTTEFDMQKIDDELLNVFRSNLNSYDTKSRVTEMTKTILTTSETTYFISNFMNYISSVTLDGTALTFGAEYTINWRDDNKGSITLSEEPDTDLDLVIVYGEKLNRGSFIYPDLPRNDLSLDKYPRIGFRTSFTREMIGGDGNNAAFNNTGLLQIKVVALTTAEINKLITALDTYILNNFKSFYYIRYIDPSSISNYDNFGDNTDKPLFKIIEYNIPHKYQIRSV